MSANKRMTVCGVIEITVYASSPEDAIEKANARADSLMNKYGRVVIGIEHDPSDVRDKDGNFMEVTA